MRNRMIGWMAAATALAAALDSSGDVMYQWAIPVERPDGRTCTAYVWIPPAAERVRGVFIGGEAYIAGDPAIRQACAEANIAIIRAGIDGIFNYKTGPGPEIFLKVLAAVAEATGYGEIARAPFFAFGHSTSCIYATAAATWKPTRCFGSLAFKGSVMPPTYDPEADLSGIPILAVKGQFEEFGPGPSGVLRDFEDRETAWKEDRAKYLRMRGENGNVLISLIVEAGSTHMEWTPRVGEYAALFLRKAAQARIPDWPVGAAEPVMCKSVDVASGALTSPEITAPDAPKAAPYAEYKGDRKAAYWHIDMELARAFEAFHAGRFGKRAQFVAFADPANGNPIYSRHDLRYGTRVAWVEPDVFRVAGTFLTEARDKYAKPEGPIGQADGPIRFRLFGLGGRDIEAVGPDTFRVVSYGGRGMGGSITAYHPGDDMYRPAEQPAGVRHRLLTDGESQAIEFPEIAALKPGGEVKLAATSSKGLSVRYVVQNGPAAIEGDVLKVQDIPPRAKLPLTVEVTAYQWGSAVEPFVQTAAPVTRTVTVAR